MTDAEKSPREFWVAPKLHNPIDPVEAEYFHAFDLPGDPNRLEIHCIEFSAFQEAQEKIKHLEARVEKLANDFKNAVIACKTLAENHSVELSDEVAHFLIVELEGNYLRCALEDIAALKEDEEQTK